MSGGLCCRAWRQRLKNGASDALMAAPLPRMLYYACLQKIPMGQGDGGLAQRGLLLFLA
jgi:hypothetical protein